MLIVKDKKNEDEEEVIEVPFHEGSPLAEMAPEERHTSENVFEPDLLRSPKKVSCMISLMGSIFRMPSIKEDEEIPSPRKGDELVEATTEGDVTKVLELESCTTGKEIVIKGRGEKKGK
jgi:hypothetical protein